MLNGNKATKSSLIQVLMAKANGQLEAGSNRSKIIGQTISAILPILREHTKMLDGVIQRLRIRKACASVGKK